MERLRSGVLPVKAPPSRSAFLVSVVVQHSATVDEEHPVGTCAPAMTLYYADPGEKVWDIAKRYGSTPSAVAQENAIEGDAVEDRRMLMIPAVI